MVEESFGLVSQSPPVIRAEASDQNRIGSPTTSNPRSQPRYMSDQLFSSSFAFSLTRFQTLLGSQAAIFIALSKSLSTLLIASFLV